ncbi:hypothetical protein S40288_06821 [Stachybotrys chartarum IBT 40288]|nr:hypothetical protein S40288_06821 [Stachybotrys chartarum IBT 40288]
MDLYSLVRTTLGDIYAMTVFIRTAVDDVRGRAEALENYRDEFDHEITFLEAFNATFFGWDGQRGIFESLSESFRKDIDTILRHLKGCLTAYTDVSSRHQFDLSGAKALLNKQESIEPRSNNGKNDIPEEAPTKDQNEKKSWDVRSKLDGFAAKFKQEENLRKIEWWLLDKEQLGKLLVEYRTWTERLRQNMIVLLLMNNTAKSRNNLDEDTSRALGVEKVIQRQTRAKLDQPIPMHIRRLDGRFTPDPTYTSTGSAYSVGTLESFAGPLSIILERHNFVIGGQDMTPAKKKEMKLKLVRQLVWLLKDEPMTKAVNPRDGITPMFLLECRGFHARGDELSLVYMKPAQAGAMITLHDWISPDGTKLAELREEEYVVGRRTQAAREENRAPKQHYELLRKLEKLVKGRRSLEEKRLVSMPSLGSRYYLAWALACTLYNIHASGWVHKDIWSHAIVTFGAHDASTATQDTVPFLLGWSVSRPQTDEYRDVSGFNRGEAPGHLAGRVEQVEIKDEVEDWSENEDDNKDNNGEGNANSEKAGRELEHELYRHPDRYENESVFENKHDIYSFGVVLLEIGLWSTVSTEMYEVIAKARRRPAELPRFAVQEIKQKLADKAQDARLMQQMGHEYASIVGKCLKGDFKSLKGKEPSENGGRDEEHQRSRIEEAELAMEFQKTVVEPLRSMALLI